jgi:hypothetical protein
MKKKITNAFTLLLVPILMLSSVVVLTSMLLGMSNDAIMIPNIDLRNIEKELVRSYDREKSYTHKKEIAKDVYMDSDLFMAIVASEVFNYDNEGMKFTYPSNDDISIAPYYFIDNNELFIKLNILGEKTNIPLSSHYFSTQNKI